MDLEEQENELLALESILDPNSFSFDTSSGEIKIHANLKCPFLKIETPFETNVGDSTSSKADYKVQNLPPFILSFSYPSTYPSVLPPVYTLSCIWLSKHQVWKFLSVNYLQYLLKHLL